MEPIVGTLPTQGYNFNPVTFEETADDIKVTAEPINVNINTGDAAIYKVELVLDEPDLVDSVTIILRNRHGGIVADPGPIVSAYQITYPKLNDLWTELFKNLLFVSAFSVLRLDLTVYVRWRYVDWILLGAEICTASHF